MDETHKAVEEGIKAAKEGRFAPTPDFAKDGDTEYVFVLQSKDRVLIGVFKNREDASSVSSEITGSYVVDWPVE